MTDFSEKPHVLVVDDDNRLRALLEKFLRENRFLVSVAADAAAAREMMRWFAFDLMVFDVMMPGETGLALLASLKDRRVPVLMLSAMGDTKDRISGLEHGAEDYLAKPFEPQELLLRIKSLLRRNAPASSARGRLRFGEYMFDCEASRLLRGEEDIYLTTSEAALLKLLAATPGEPVSREALAKGAGVANERSVDVQINRLRRKIESGDKPVHLQTVRGAGYVLYAS